MLFILPWSLYYHTMHAQEKLQIGIDWTDDEWECTIQFADFVNDYYVVNSYQLLILVLVWPQ